MVARLNLLAPRECRFPTPPRELGFRESKKPQPFGLQYSPYLEDTAGKAREGVQKEAQNLQRRFTRNENVLYSNHRLIRLVTTIPSHVISQPKVIVPKPAAATNGMRL
jgi:hypothetical protein